MTKTEENIKVYKWEFKEFGLFEAKVTNGKFSIVQNVLAFLGRKFPH